MRNKYKLKKIEVLFSRSKYAAKTQAIFKALDGARLEYSFYPSLRGRELNPGFFTLNRVCCIKNRHRKGDLNEFGYRADWDKVVAEHYTDELALEKAFNLAITKWPEVFRNNKY